MNLNEYSLVIDAYGAAVATKSNSRASNFKKVSLAEWFKAFASKANGVPPREFESFSSTLFLLHTRPYLL